MPQMTRKMRGVADTMSRILGVGGGGRGGVRSLASLPLLLPLGGARPLSDGHRDQNPPDSQSAAPPGGTAVRKRYPSARKFADGEGRYFWNAGDWAFPEETVSETEERKATGTLLDVFPPLEKVQLRIVSCQGIEHRQSSATGP